MSDTPPPIEDHSVGLLHDEVREDDARIVLADDRPDSGNYPPGTFRSTVSGMLTLLMMIGATYVLPGLEWARPWTAEDPVPFWNLIGRELLGEGDKADADDAAVRDLAALALAEADADGHESDGEQPFVKPVIRPPGPDDEPIPPYAPTEDDAEPPAVAFENPERLDRFYAALTQTDLGLAGAITRASHWGDSAIGNDGITGAIRSKMQARFGDAGHGFHLLGQPNSSYRHVGVKVSEKSPWHHCFIIQGCRDDGFYGFGGTSFESTAGAEIRIGTATKGSQGRSVSRFEVYYAGMPRGGNLRLQLDDEDPIKVPTGAEELENRWHTVETDDGAHSLSIRAAGGGKVRAFGVTLERDGPGVVWDGLSQIGALTRRMLHWDRDHIRAQVRHRETDLVVLMFGGNDMNMRGTMEKYKGELRELIQLFNGEGVDNPPACLIMAPLDHGERRGQQIITREIVPQLVEAQREVAEAEGCAFFDTYAAMGGEGSMGRWARAEPKLGSGDLAHLSYHGHKVIGAMVYSALLDGYRGFRGRVEGRPIRALEAISDHGVEVKALGEIDLDALLGPSAPAPAKADASAGGSADATPKSHDPSGALDADGGASAGPGERPGAAAEAADPGAAEAAPPTPDDAPADAPADAPTDTPADAPTGTPTETPADTAADSPQG